MDLIKVQLKDLFRFSEDSQYISEDVVAVVREHQRYESWDQAASVSVGVAQIDHRPQVLPGSLSTVSPSGSFIIDNIRLQSTVPVQLNHGKLIWNIPVNMLGGKTQ